MQCLVLGWSSKRVAKALGLSDLTVRKHRENLMRKLQVRTVAQLVGLSVGLRTPLAPR